MTLIKVGYAMTSTLFLALFTLIKDDFSLIKVAITP